MRMLILGALIAGFLPVADQPKDDAVKNEAEKLFRIMEEKLDKAKTLECVFDGYLPTDLGSFEGTLLLAEGNKVRLEINKSKDDGLQLTPEAAKKYGKMRLRIVSDGVHLMMEGNGLDRPQLRDTPKNLNADILTWMSRTGLLLPQAPLPDQKVDCAKDRFVVSDFKLGIREKIADRDTQRLEYQLSAKGADTPIFIVVWLDLKTLLPVKRTLGERPLDGKQRELTENYTKLTLDVKVDAKKFELPK